MRVLLDHSSMFAVSNRHGISTEYWRQSSGNDHRLNGGCGSRNQGGSSE